MHVAVNRSIVAFVISSENVDSQGSPNRLKAIQLAKARNWEAEMHSKKLEVLQPIIIGICWWTPDVTAPDPIYNKLKEFKVN